MARRASTRLLLAFALALALPAYLLTNESFRPIEERLQLESGKTSHSFDLAAREPLFIEYSLILRAPAGARPTAVLELNDTPAATLQGDRLYAPQRGMLLLPLALVRSGENRLHLAIVGAPSATFELQARVHNYYGIAPDFPRVFVVADESVAHVASERSVIRRTLRFGVFYLASVLVLWAGAHLAGRRRSGAGTSVLLVAPSMVLWAALVYGFATPLHIWLSLEALVVVVVVGWALSASALWIVANRVGVLQFAAVTMVTLVLAESALRLFNYLSPSFIFYSDAYSRYRGQPGAPHYDARLNSRGFNDVEHEPSKPPNVAHRIVAIGDSFALGVVPYRANYLTLLESELAETGPVEVVNMGVAATEPIDYLAILVKEGLAFEPDLVMVGFFVGNDFEAPGRKPYEYSYVATFVHFLWQLWGAGMPVVATPDGRVVQYDDDGPGLTWDRFLEVEMDRAGIYVNDADSLARATARVAGHLREMRDISRRAGADFAVVLIPDEAQVDVELQGEVVRASGLAGDQLDFQLPNRLIAAALAKDRIRVLDLLPVFREQGRQVRLYKPQDTHWNLAGNRLAAATIGAFLREQLLGAQERGSDR